VKEDYVFVNDVPEEDRIRGDLPPTKKEECEVCHDSSCISLLLKYISSFYYNLGFFVHLRKEVLCVESSRLKNGP